MALHTLIASGCTETSPSVPPSGSGRALVLMGGGARTAYQAGVLRGLARLLHQAGHPTDLFPFRVLVGTSAGALNASFLASQALLGVQALDGLAEFWRQLQSHQVYRLETLRWWRRPNLFTAGLTLMLQVRKHRALLDTLPLVDTLHKRISLEGIERSLNQGTIDALAVTASSYTTGEHWTFYQAREEGSAPPWRRPGRRACLQPITIEHLMASSAIPFLFPAVPLWVDGHKEYFGDGSMRQLSPLSPAIQLGARKVLVIGVGQPQRAGLGGTGLPSADPTAGTIAAHALASVFHDTLQADVEQAQRVSASLTQLPPDVGGALPFRPVEVLALQPRVSLDDLALKHVDALPRAVRDTLMGLGALDTHRSAGASAAAMASYLLFEAPFVNALMGCGESDALARKDELLAFFDFGSS
jgi:NTE family protein